ncbi:MAG TPA: hypothetical protein VFE32_02720 [Puia sp.]|jgi:hypothetical protein|nr:hypothetical protein [Puia sp.]
MLDDLRPQRHLEEAKAILQTNLSSERWSDLGPALTEVAIPDKIN